MPKRKSMKGMGADAYFLGPADQQASESVSQQGSTPAVPLVKATFYLTPENILRLERLRLERLERGEKIDKSALVREAIDLLPS